MCVHVCECVCVLCQSACLVFRVGQNHIYTVHIRYFWQGITICTVFHGVCKWFRPTLLISCTARLILSWTFLYSMAVPN